MALPFMLPRENARLLAKKATYRFNCEYTRYDLNMETGGLVKEGPSLTSRDGGLDGDLNVSIWCG